MLDDMIAPMGQDDEQNKPAPLAPQQPAVTLPQPSPELDQKTVGDITGQGEGVVGSAPMLEPNHAALDAVLGPAPVEKTGKAALDEALGPPPSAFQSTLALVGMAGHPLDPDNALRIQNFADNTAVGRVISRIGSNAAQGWADEQDTAYAAALKAMPWIKDAEAQDAETAGSFHAKYIATPLMTVLKAQAAVRNAVAGGLSQLNAEGVGPDGVDHFIKAMSDSFNAAGPATQNGLMYFKIRDNTATPEERASYEQIKAQMLAEKPPEGFIENAGAMVGGIAGALWDGYVSESAGTAALAGGGIGAAVGGMAGGVGAVPGAVAGSRIGATAGAMARALEAGVGKRLEKLDALRDAKGNAIPEWAKWGGAILGGSVDAYMMKILPGFAAKEVAKEMDKAIERGLEEEATRSGLMMFAQGMAKASAHSAAIGGGATALDSAAEEFGRGMANIFNNANFATVFNDKDHLHQVVEQVVDETMKWAAFGGFMHAGIKAGGAALTGTSNLLKDRGMQGIEQTEAFRNIIKTLDPSYAVERKNIVAQGEELGVFHDDAAYAGTAPLDVDPLVRKANANPITAPDSTLHAAINQTHPGLIEAHDGLIQQARDAHLRLQEARERAQAPLVEAHQKALDEINAKIEAKRAEAQEAAKGVDAVAADKHAAKLGELTGARDKLVAEHQAAIEKLAAEIAAREKTAKDALAAENETAGKKHADAVAPLKAARDALAEKQGKEMEAAKAKLEAKEAEAKAPYFLPNAEHTESVKALRDRVAELGKAHDKAMRAAEDKIAKKGEAPAAKTEIAKGHQVALASLKAKLEKLKAEHPEKLAAHDAKIGEHKATEPASAGIAKKHAAELLRLEKARDKLENDHTAAVEKDALVARARADLAALEAKRGELEPHVRAAFKEAGGALPEDQPIPVREEAPRAAPGTTYHEQARMIADDFYRQAKAAVGDRVDDQALRDAATLQAMHFLTLAHRDGGASGDPLHLYRTRGPEIGSGGSGRGLAQPENRISTRIPTSKKLEADPHASNDLIVGLESSKASGAAFEKNAGLLKKYLGIDVGRLRSPHAIAEKVMKHMIDNLLFLHDSVPAEIRERSKLWYDGANRIAAEWADEFKTERRAMAGVLAALSPQKDWFQNVSLARRVVEAWHKHQDTVTTPEMLTWAEKYASRLDGEAEKAAKKGDAKAAATAREGAATARAAAAEVDGKRLRDLTDDGLRAVWVRMHDEAHSSRDYPIITPEGGKGAIAVTAKGEPQKVAWGSYKEIGKAIAVLRDPSRENISASMGGNHKVRNFYNNIIAPNATRGDVTIDTHAVAADLLRPLAGAHEEVKHALGLSGAKSAETGDRGMYGIHAEAYRRAAEQRGILPREMQSITWEAVRGLFSPEQKRNAKLTASIDGVWKDVESGKITADEARGRIVELAGGIEHPDWYRPGDEHVESAQQAGDAGVVHRGELGVDARSMDGGARDGAAGTVQEEGLAQKNRGLTTTPHENAARMRSYIRLLEHADPSTLVHEMMHDWLHWAMKDVKSEHVPQKFKDEVAGLLKWLGVKDWDKMSPAEYKRAHERTARGFEIFLSEGHAPTPALKAVFERFRNWMLDIYQSLKNGSLRDMGKDAVAINDDVRSFFNSLIHHDANGTVVESVERVTVDTHRAHEIEAETAHPSTAHDKAEAIRREVEEIAAEHDQEVHNAITERSGPEEKTGGDGEKAPDAGEPALKGEPAGKVDTPAPAEKVNDGGTGPAEEGPGASRGNGGSAAAPVAPNAPFPPEKTSRIVEDKAHNIRLDNVRSSEDFKEYVREWARDNPDNPATSNGTLSDGERLATAEALGITPANFRPSNPDNVPWHVWATAVQKVSWQTVMDLKAAAKAFADNPTDETAQAYEIAKTRRDMAMAEFSDVTRMAGLTLRSMIRPKEDIETYMARFRKTMTEDSLAQSLIEARMAADIEDPASLARYFQAKRARPRLRDYVIEYYITNLISGPITHMGYAVHNIGLIGWKLPETFVAEVLRDGGIKNIADVQKWRDAATITGEAARGMIGADTRVSAWSAIKTAWALNIVPFLPGEQTALRAKAEELAQKSYNAGRDRPSEAAYKAAYAATSNSLIRPGMIRGENIAHSISSTFGKDISKETQDTIDKWADRFRSPTKLIQVIHTATEVMAYGQEIAILARRAATDKGLTGREADAAVRQFLQNPPEEAMAIARDESRKMALMRQSEYGGVVGALRTISNSSLPAKLAMPFVQIVANVLHEGLVERSVLGLGSERIRANLMGERGEGARAEIARLEAEGDAKALADYKDRLRIDQATQWAKLTLGTGITIGVMSLAASGVMTGAGPENPNERRQWLLNHQPYSIKIGGYWIPYRGGSLGTLMGVSADIVEIYEHAHEEDLSKLLGSMIGGIEKAILDESMFRGIKEILNLSEHSDKSVGKFGMNLAGNFLPWAVGMGQVSQGVDPYFRETRTLMDVVKKKIPGLSTGVYGNDPMAPKRDLWGQPIESHISFPGLGIPRAMLGGTWEKSAEQEPINSEMTRLGIHPSAVPKKIRGVELTPEQYDQFAAQAGQLARSRLDPVVNAPGWAAMHDYAKEKLIKKVIASSRAVAANSVIVSSMGTENDILKLATEAKLELLTPHWD